MHDTFQNIQNQIEDKLLALAKKVGDIVVKEVGLVLDGQHPDNSKKVAMSKLGLKQSINYTVVKEVSKATVTVGTNKYYAPFVHNGTRPHFPPIAPIRQWVIDKGLAKRTLKSGKNKGKETFIRNTKSKSDSAIVNSIAYAIVRKIGRKGTKGIRFFDIALKTAEPKILKELNEFKLAL